MARSGEELCLLQPGEGPGEGSYHMLNFVIFSALLLNTGSVLFDQFLSQFLLNETGTLQICYICIEDLQVTVWLQ